MVQDIIPSTLIALAVAFPLHSTPVSSIQTGFPVVYEVAQTNDYTVQPGDSLGSIATKAYGDPSYWTTLWNDNEWIEDPSLIEAGWQLRLREASTPKAEVLKKSLQAKITIATTNIHVYQSDETGANEVAVPTSTPSPVAIISSSSAGGPLNDAQIQFLGSCEAGMDPSKNTGNGYYGAFQFSYGTWKSMGTAYERADLAPLDVQIDAVQRLVQRSSIFTQFPACSRKMRNIGLI